MTQDDGAKNDVTFLYDFWEKFQTDIQIIVHILLKWVMTHLKMTKSGFYLEYYSKQISIKLLSE